MNANTNTELGNDPQPQLYDLTDDLGERRNVAGEHPEVVRELTERLARVRKAAGRVPDGFPKPPSARRGATDYNFARRASVPGAPARRRTPFRSDP